MSDDIDHGRRGVLAGAVAAALSTILLPTAKAVSGLAASETPAGDPDPSVFPQGVASGDPTPDGMVVWTRVDPDATRPDEPLRLTVHDETDGHAPGSAHRASWTTRPPETVIRTSRSPTSPGSTAHGDRSSTTKSASFPGSTVPMRSSSKPA